MADSREYRRQDSGKTGSGADGDRRSGTQRMPRVEGDSTRESTRERASHAYRSAVEQSRRDSHGRGAHDAAPRRNRPAGVRSSSYSRRADAAIQASRRRRRVMVKRAVLAIAAAVVVVVVAGVLARGFMSGETRVETPDNSIVGVNSTTTAQPKLPTPIMAKSKGVYLHCAVSMDDLTEILIHNASYSYALPITTQLAEATNVDVMAAHGTGRDKASQPTGDAWMTGEFIRTFRSGNGGPRMSAIDCGAAAGSQVYAPVTGTVLLVKQYKLYKKYDDYIVHIQPEGKPNLDVCMIHLTDPTVQAGDQVTAGETPVAKVRDVYALIGEQMDLKKYTAEGDNGNHTHIQVNNVKAKNYHGLDDLKTGSSASAGESTDANGSAAQ